MPILFICPDQILKTFRRIVHALTADPDPGKVTVEASTLTATVFSVVETTRTIEQPAVRVLNTDRSRSGARFRSEDELGRPDSPRGPGPISLPSVAMTPVGPTGWPLRLSPAALLTHGNRLYREAYLVLQRGSALTIEGSDSASN